MTRGTYLILCEILEPQTIQIGKLGMIPFEASYYCYVGSAMGDYKSSTCLEHRVKRHLRSRFQSTTKDSEIHKDPPKKHWHIDYLLAHPGIQINKVYLFPSGEKIECEIAQWISEFADGYIPKFGCSDCTCESHLFRIKEKSPLIG
jgi:sugar fermentation stimulation protein A